jgi:hypothetical protein
VIRGTQKKGDANETRAAEMRNDFDSGLSSYIRNPIGPAAMSAADAPNCHAPAESHWL